MSVAASAEGEKCLPVMRMILEAIFGLLKFRLVWILIALADLVDPHMKSDCAWRMHLSYTHEMLLSHERAFSHGVNHSCCGETCASP